MSFDGRRAARASRVGRKHRAVHLDEATYREAQAQAQRAGVSFSAWVEILIRREAHKATGPLAGAGHQKKELEGRGEGNYLVS